MKGTIKFVDSSTGLWGYILPEDGSPDVHFNVREFVGRKPIPSDAGLPMEFEIQTVEGKRHAMSPRLLETSRQGSNKLLVDEPGRALTNWAFVPFKPFRTPEGKSLPTATELLAGIALRESWHFGRQPNQADPYPILRNYLKYTFYRLAKENKVAGNKKDGWAAFNTGLVDRLYDPVYALFKRQDRPGGVPWRLYAFCVPGQDDAGRLLVRMFSPLPERASYFASNFDMLLDTERADKEFYMEWDHVIVDAVREGRFPKEFLRQHQPRLIQWQDYSDMDSTGRSDFLSRLAEAIEQDDQCMRTLSNRLRDAKTLAVKRTMWNFKTAIPQYYPRLDMMSLLLPLALVNDEKVDLAMVVTRNENGSYQGRTVLPLAWAYSNARLVCRPDSDWLSPDAIAPEEMIEAGEEAAERATAEE